MKGLDCLIWPVIVCFELNSFLESEAKPIIIDRRFSRGGINFCRNPSNEETGTNFNTSLESQTEMETDEQDFQNVVDENMDHEIVDNFVDNISDQNVQITKFWDPALDS